MKQRALQILIKAYLDSHAEVKAAQIDGLTWAMIADALGISLASIEGMNNITLDKIKARATDYLKERDAKIFKTAVMGQLQEGRTWLKNNYPDASADWGRGRNGDPCLKLYPFARTPVEEAE